MSRSFWGIIMVFSMIITAWSGFFVYNELQTKDQESVAVPLKQVQPAPVAATVEPSTATATSPEVAAEPVAPEPKVEEKPVATTKEKPKTEKKTAAKSKPGKPGEKQSVTFKLEMSDAKKVFVIGDFNKWYRQPLKREGDVWKTTVKLPPGSYEYVFVVDDGDSKHPAGKRILDPKSKSTSDGKLSILNVKTSSDE